MDVNIENRADWERRRILRLTQVREQSKTVAKTIRDRVHSAIEVQLKQQETIKNKKEHTFKSLALNKLKSDFNYLIQDVGNGYSVASIQPDANIVLAEKRLVNRCKAISRGAEAEKRQKQVQEEEQMDKEMRERMTHFNKTVEKIRSRLITSVPNIDSGVNNHMQNINKHNECFLIPSQVTLNESDIINWNNTKKTAKPWSVVFNSKENHMSNQYLHQPTTFDNDKENEYKFPKLETDMNNYETLVKELNKLSTDEQNIRNKLFTHNWKLNIKDVPVTIKKSVPHSQETDRHKEMDKTILDNNTELNEIKNPITEKKIDELDLSSSMLYMSSSSSTSTKYEHPVPVKSINKIVRFKNNVNVNNTTQSSKKLNFNKKSTTERPLRNINNTLQRIQQQKKMLVKEISADFKKPKKVSSNFKPSTTSKNHAVKPAGNALPQESVTTYAKLPDSFYNSQLETLKKHILRNKFKTNDSKPNESTNVDLMKYINVLLKMTPSDVENLSISSCSSVHLEESILENSKKNNAQYYSEILNCITKCLNSDMSDISQDTMFDSPKNINLLNRLQDISNYYLKKTHEMKNICDESPQHLNDQLKEQKIETEDEVPENMSINLSSNSSVDGEYILGHLKTLLQKKGLIKSDKEWPMFENISDDDNRSLTDQLLDVYPRRLNDN